jgi:parvulin-like peptidyl-prolyl isomerase
MKNFLFLVFVCAFVSLLKAEEKKIAQVDKTYITLNEVYVKMSANYFTKTLDDLISEKLLINYANKNDIKVVKNEVQNIINNIKSRFNSEKDFKKELLKMNISEKDYSKMIENELLAQKALISILNLNVTDEDAKRYYDSNPEQFKIPQSVKLRQIFVNTEQEANDVYIALEAGANFEKMAELKSVDENLKKKAGDLGYITKGMLIPEIEKEVFAMEANKYTKPIKTGNGYSIIKVEDKKNERTIPFEDIKEKIKGSIKFEIINQNKNRVLNILKEKSEIKIF